MAAQEASNRASGAFKALRSRIAKCDGARRRSRPRGWDRWSEGSGDAPLRDLPLGRLRGRHLRLQRLELPAVVDAADAELAGLGEEASVFLVGGLRQRRREQVAAGAVGPGAVGEHGGT